MRRLTGRREEIRATTTEAPVAVSAASRDFILTCASDLLPAPARTPGAVLAVARPLLEYAAQATGKADLQARMNAMGHAHCNSRRQLRTPDEFLAEASAYYDFLLETA